jgi:hypothetical protein
MKTNAWLDDSISEVAYGSREAMQAEYGTLPCFSAPFLVLPVGAGEYDPVECETLAEAKKAAKFLAGGLPVFRVA